MNDWRIHRREAHCTRCERPFEEEETFFSVLSVTEESLQREDRCAACFESSPPAKVAEDAPGLRSVLFWRTRYLADRRARFAVDFEAIEELFLTLEGRREGTLTELRYLLSLLLMRKKRLKLVGVRRTATGEVMCVRRPRRQEEFEVQVFELNSERVQALQGELARVFEGAGAEALDAPLGPESATSSGREAPADVECPQVAEVGTSEPAG